MLTRRQWHCLVLWLIAEKLNFNWIRLKRSRHLLQSNSLIFPRKYCMQLSNRFVSMVSYPCVYMIQYIVALRYETFTISNIISNRYAAIIVRSFVIFIFFFVLLTIRMNDSPEAHFLWTGLSLWLFFFDEWIELNV